MKKNLFCIVLIININSNNTTVNTVFITNKCLKNLQVKKLRIMFVSESNES